MHRSTIAVTVLCLLLLGLNVAQFIANQTLGMEVEALQSQREDARTLREATESRGMRGSARSLGTLPPQLEAAVRSAPSPGSVGASGGPEGSAANEAAGEERMRAFRERMVDHMMNRMLDAVAETAYQRGWSPEMGADAAMIIEESWRSGAAVREAIRDGDVDSSQAHDEMLAVRDIAREELEALLGPQEHAALQKQMWSRPGLMGRGGPQE